MEITNISWGDSRWPILGDYSVHVVTDEGENISARQRVVRGFPRLKLNVWALILSVLSTFKEDDFEYRGNTHVLGGTDDKTEAF